MTKRTIALCTLVVTSLVAAIGFGTWSTASAAPTALKGSVGPSETISLKNARGKRLAMVARGTYRLTVTDRSDEHNFYVSGPGLRKQITSVGFTGTKTVTLKLRPGKYAFVCTPHSDDMRGSFTVR
jgi:Copper binding proteins, plastocyanin/azurin family